MPKSAGVPTHDCPRPVPHLYPEVRAGVTDCQWRPRSHAITPSRHDDPDRAECTRQPCSFDEPTSVVVFVSSGSEIDVASHLRNEDHWLFLAISVEFHFS